MVLLRLFVEPLILVAVARRALAGQFWLLEEEGRTGPLRTAFRLYPRAFFISFLLATLAVLAYHGLDINPDLAGQSDLLTRLRDTAPRIPFSIIKVLWIAALVVEGRGIFRSGGRGIKLLVSSRPVMLAVIAWTAVLLMDVLVSPIELRAAGYPAWISWGVFSAGMGTLVAFFFYAVALREYRVLYGVVSLPLPVGSETALESGAMPVPGQARTVSLWLVVFSFLPIVSVVALFRGRSAGRALGWRSIRAILAVSCGAFSTAAQLLICIGFLVSFARGTGDDYSFLAQGDPSVGDHVHLLQAGRFMEVEETLRTPESASESWGHLAALGIAQTKLGYPSEALVNFERASKRGANRGEFYELYGRLLLSQGRPSEAADRLRQASKGGLSPQRTANLLALTRSGYKPSKVVGIIWSIGILMVLFTVHEFAHAWAAFKLGDDTAAQQGRLTFNPIAHLDIVGSLLLPGILLWRQSDMVFGWAKPVPVDPEKFSNPKHDHMLVSFAGPAANLLMMFVAVLLFFASLVFIQVWSPDVVSADLGNPFSNVLIAGAALPDWVAPVIAFLKQLMATSLILAFFNLIPVPPLDGSWILSGILPERFQGIFEGIRRYGFIVFLVLVFTSVLDYLLVVPILGMWVGTTAACMLMGFQ